MNTIVIIFWFFIGCLLGIMILSVVLNYDKPSIYARIHRRFIPSCKKCKLCCNPEDIGFLFRCNNQLYLEYIERTKSIKYERVGCDLVRGTKFCKFKDGSKS